MLSTCQSDVKLFREADPVGPAGHRLPRYRLADGHRVESSRVIEAIVVVSNAMLGDTVADRASKLSQDARERLTLVVHELRAPLTVIRGYMQLLDRSLEDDLLLDAASAASRAGSRLEVLLDDLMAAVSGPEMFAPAVREAVDIKNVAEDVAADLRRLANQRISVAGDACLVSGDENRLRQVLDNLLSNAIKHAPEGGDVYVDICHEDADRGVVRVSVEDTGPGIEPADRERVFDLFERLEKGNRAPEGLGLGLPISRAIIEGHGGTLTLADPVRGAGARFVADLPAHR